MKISKTLSLLLILLVQFCFFSCNKGPDADNSSLNHITITSITPSHGPYNTVTTVSGIGFDKLGNFDSVLINGKKLNFISQSATQVVVQIPEATGSGNISLWYHGSEVKGPFFRYDSTFFVTTVAGSMDQGMVNGDGVNARFWGPKGIVAGKDGNIYVADYNNNNIRKITPDGFVSIFAGSATGEAGYREGLGTQALFAGPLGMSIDSSNNLYVGDEFNYRVRKISPAGQVSTVVGLWWSTGPPGGQIDGDKSYATFNTPRGVAVAQDGNIYIADYYNNKIRKVTPAGTVSTYAGGDYYHFGFTDGPLGTNLFFTPFALAADPSGNIFVVDGDNQMVRKITPDQKVQTMVGPKMPSSDELVSSWAIASDHFGNIFFSVHGGILKMTPGGTIIRYAMGGTGQADGPIQFATYTAIGGIAIDGSGNMFITDNNKVRKIAWR